MPKKKRREPEPETTLDSKKKAVAADEEKLREQMARYAKLIEDAPRIKKERERRQREEYVSRASRVAEQRPNGRATLPDRRFDLQSGAKMPTVPDRQRRLRAERNQGRFMFFVLLLIFAAVICWVYFTLKTAPPLP